MREIDQAGFTGLYLATPLKDPNWGLSKVEGFGPLPTASTGFVDGCPSLPAPKLASAAFAVRENCLRCSERVDLRVTNCATSEGREVAGDAESLKQKVLITRASPPASNRMTGKADTKATA